jgi:hypothetical protein
MALEIDWEPHPHRKDALMATLAYGILLEVDHYPNSPGDAKWSWTLSMGREVPLLDGGMSTKEVALLRAEQAAEKMLEACAIGKD